ncbi:hypothetical protein [Enterobacter hormaechei]|uniref:hypothetical protein n=1 Tax=Enterobacter hormaechei TaxID=158836 RepID=UPI0034D5DBBC
MSNNNLTNERLSALIRVARDSLELYEMELPVIDDVMLALAELQQRRAAMLQGKAEPVTTVKPAIFIDGNISPDDADKLAEAISKFNSERREPQEMIAEPVSQRDELPEGYCIMPMKLTAENGAKGALSGEFSETKFINCPECFGDDECETCDGSGRIEISVPVSWTTIKEIWTKGVEHFTAAPQQEVK